MHEALANAAEQFVAHAADERKKGDTKGLDAGMLDYFAEIFGEALAKPQPVGGALTDERIEDIYRDLFGRSAPDYIVEFARAVLATLSAPVAQPGEAVSDVNAALEAVDVLHGLTLQQSTAGQRIDAKIALKRAILALATPIAAQPAAAAIQCATTTAQRCSSTACFL
jgi:hypothetical protein